jgi:hypothetical protein
VTDDLSQLFSESNGPVPATAIQLDEIVRQGRTRRRRHRALLITAGISVALGSAFVATAAASHLSRGSASQAAATATASPQTTQAQAIASNLIGGASGKADAAAFVSSTLAAYLKANPSDAGAYPEVDGQDTVLLVKVHGTFDGSLTRQPAGFAGPKVANNLVILYDFTTGRSLMSASFEGAAPDVSNSGAPAAGGAPTPFDLRSLGTPIALSVT